MKILLSTLLLLGASAGWYGLAPDGSAAPEAVPSPCAEDCTVTLECTPQGTCLLTCRDDAGAVVCEQELPCPKSCEPDTASCERPCPTTPACAQECPSSR